MNTELFVIASQYAGRGTAIELLLTKQRIINDHHRNLLMKEIRDRLNKMSDTLDAKSLRKLLRFVVMTEPKTLTTMQYGHA